MRPCSSRPRSVRSPALAAFGALAALGAPVVLAGCAPARASGAAPADGRPPEPVYVAGALGPVIDVHTHTEFSGEPERTSAIPDTRERYLAERRAAGVVGSVAHGAADGGGWQDLAAEHVLYCYGVGDVVDPEALDAGLASGRYGCVKLYLGYVHRFAADPAYEPVYALARKHDVPVVFHTGDTYSTRGKLKYSDPLTIDEVAVDHPEVRFVIAHCGNPWIESAAEVAYKNPNVYLECSAMLIGDLAAKDPERVDTYVVRPIRWLFGYLEDPEKLMFGTDWPLTVVGPYLEAYARAIPPEHHRAVFHDNALRVFRIPGLARPTAPAGSLAPEAP